MDAAELVVRITGDIDDIERKLTRTTKAATSFGDKMESTGRRMTSAGQAMTAGLTVPLAALGGFALKTAIDFESAFAGVRKTVDGSEADFAQLEAGIRNMAKTIPATAVEIAGVAEAAGQLGVAKENILAFSRTMIDLGETTNLTADDAANAFARIANITKMPQDQFDELASTLVALGNAGASTEADITAMALRIAGAGSQVGLTQAQIMSFASALSSVGIEAEAGGTAISSGFIKISKAVADGGAELDEFAKVAGMSSAAFATAFEDDAAGAMVTFVEGLGRVKDEGGNVFQTMADLGMEEIRLRDAFLRLAGAGTLLKDNLALGNQAWTENTALAAEAEKRYQTTAAQLTVFWNRVKDAAMTLGAELVPALMGAVDAAEPLGRFVVSAVEWFGALPGPVKTFIIALAGIVAIAGPILIAVGTVVSAISTIAPVVAAAAGLLLGPVGLIVAAIVAIGIAAYALWRNWDTVWGAITGAFGAAYGFITEHLAMLILPFSPLIAALVWMAQNWSSIWSGITGTLGAAASWISDRLSDMVGWFGALPGRIVGALASLPGLLYDVGWDALQGLWNGLRARATAVLSWASNMGKRILGAIGNAIGWGSPATEFVAMGEDSMKGLMIGYEAYERQLLSQLSHLGQATLAVSPGSLAPAPAPTAGAGVGGQPSGIDNEALATAIANKLAPLEARLLAGLLQAQGGQTEAMHLAREIAWQMD